MGFELNNELLHGLQTVVHFVLPPEALGGARGVGVEDFAADGFEGAEGEEHNVVGVVLLDELRLFALHLALLSPHNKYNNPPEKYNKRRSRQDAPHPTPTPPHPTHPPRRETRGRTLPLKLYFSIILFLASILKWLRCGNKYNNYCCPQMSHYWESQNWQSHPSQNSRTRNSQKVIQDQNYSNEIFYSLLSTLESIVRYYQGNHSSQFHNKMFKSYDRVDYGSKNIQELKKQLQTQLYVFQASKMAFDQENPNQWQLPSNFDIQKSKEFLHNALNFFDEKRDEQSFHMAKDILQIIDGHLGKLNFHNINIELGYSQSQKRGFQKNLFKQGVYSTEQMEKVGEEVKHITDVGKLTSKANQANSPFNNINKSKISMENTKKQEKMDIQKQTVYIAVYKSAKRNFEQNVEKGSAHIDNYLSNQNFFIVYWKKQEFLKNQARLRNQQYYIFQVFIEKSGKIIQSSQYPSSNQQTGNNKNSHTKNKIFIAYKNKNLKNQIREGANIHKILQSNEKDVKNFSNEKKCKQFTYYHPECKYTIQVTEIDGIIKSVQQNY